MNMGEKVDVRTAIDGNLCTCGSHSKAIEATLNASTEMGWKMVRKGRS
jgi:aerobic-type carbon monoxide dehydrogenase small subunit (CoxS/CutS family)